MTRRHSNRGRKWRAAVRRAFAEFLLVPTAIIVAFLLLAGGTFSLDRSHAAWLLPLRSILQTFVFADAQATRDLLSTIAAGIITITSITISLLLIALQQSAGALTHQVYDQFLRTWHNQVYFGVFVGLPLYALVTLASVGPLNPVIGGIVALLLTVMALCLLLVLFYTMVNQMRPVVIIEAIHDHVLRARQAQLALLRRTRRSSALAGAVSVPVAAEAHGFVTHIDVDAIEAAVRAASGSIEVVLRIHLGSYVAFGQLLAEVSARTPAEALAVAATLEGAIRREGERDLAADPLDGVEQLESIGWTAISSAQSDPDAGVLTIYSLRDILARWSVQPGGTVEEVAGHDGACVVYVDNVLLKLMDAFESLAVSASESMQHQSLAEILRTFELLFERFPDEQQQRVEDIVLRILSGLGDHVLTRDLESALTGLIATLEAAGRPATAAAMLAATRCLGRSIGKLGGRSTRPETGQQRDPSPAELA
jgi:uncharacterized membrane protein